MPFFAKNLTQASTLLFKGGFVEIKPGATVQVNERDARWGVFREAVQSGKVELYEADEARETSVSQHEVTFEAQPEPEAPVVLEPFSVNAVHVEPEVIAPMHSQVFMPVAQVEATPEINEVVFVSDVVEVEVVDPILEEVLSTETEVALEEPVIESDPEPVTILEPTPETPKPTRKYKTKS